MELTLFEFTPTRSARCRWTLLEAEIDYKSIGTSPEVLQDPDLKKAHPLSKLPAAVIDGKPLFESAAICTYIADQVPEKELIAKPGTWSRALHDQWTLFGMTEMEAYLWSNARNTFVLPEEKRLPVIFEQNAEACKRGAVALDDALANTDYLIDNRFSVTDIIMGYTVNWARRQDLLGEFSHLQRYLDRLFERPHCTLDKS